MRAGPRCAARSGACARSGSRRRPSPAAPRAAHPRSRPASPRARRDRCPACGPRAADRSGASPRDGPAPTWCSWRASASRRQHRGWSRSAAEQWSRGRSYRGDRTTLPAPSSAEPDAAGALVPCPRSSGIERRPPKKGTSDHSPFQCRSQHRAPGPGALPLTANDHERPVVRDMTGTQRPWVPRHERARRPQHAAGADDRSRRECNGPGVPATGWIAS